MRLAARVALAALVAAAASPALAAPESAVACHCFREREYRLDAPAAADPYILATTRSSTLSAVYGVTKASLVATVMKGTPADDLWVAYWAAARIDAAPTSLLDERRARGSWAAVFGPERRERLGGAFAALLAKGATDAELAAVAVDDVAVTHLRAAPDVVHVTRAAGASSSELVVSLVLAPRLRRAPTEVLAAVKKGDTTWGALLAEAGLAPSQLDETVAALVNRRTQSWLLK